MRTWPDDFVNKIVDLKPLLVGLEVMKEMPDECIDLVITSPPYPGNDKMWGELFRHNNFRKAHDFLGKVWKESLRIMRPGCKLIINIANCKRRPYIPNVHLLYQNIFDTRLAEPMGEIIWHKGYGQVGTAWGTFRNPGDLSLADQHEYIVVFRKQGKRKYYPGEQIPFQKFMSWRNTVWNISPEKASKLNHVAPFPLEIPIRLIQLYSYENEIILDPFLGSGTTAVACKELHRNFIGIEISEKYCIIARDRLRQGVL